MGQISTYNNVLTVLQDIATRHYQLNTFGVGANWEIGASDELLYPILWVNPINAKLIRGNNENYSAFEVTMRLKVLDLVDKDEANEDDVQSDTLEILKDIITEFTSHPYYTDSKFDLIGDLDFTPLDEVTDEECNGWEVNVLMRTPFQSSFCGIPAAEITGFSFPAPNFTGLTVTDVQYITNILNTDDNIQVSNAGQVYTINASGITANSNSITTNTTNINTISGDVTTNTTNINTVSGDVVTNTTNINTVSGDVTTNTTNINTISGDVTTNTTNINTISGDVTTNTTNINTVSGDVVTNTASILNKYDTSGGTISGNVVITGTTHLQENVYFDNKGETITATGTTFDLSTGNIFINTLTGSTEMDYSNPQIGTYMFEFNGQTTSSALTFASSKFSTPAGTTPALTATSGAIDTINGYYNGSQMIIITANDIQAI